MTNPLETVSEFMELSEYINDPDLTEMLEFVTKLIAKPHNDPQKVLVAIVKLQALSAKFEMLSVTYGTIKKDKAGTINNNKKNVYYSAYKALNSLVDALKYMARYGLSN